MTNRRATVRREAPRFPSESYSADCRCFSVGAIGWFAVAVTDLKTQTAVTLEKLDAMERRLEDFRTFMGDRYTGADARKDLQPILDELRDHEARLRRLETATH